MLVFGKVSLCTEGSGLGPIIFNIFLSDCHLIANDINDNKHKDASGDATCC